MKKKRLFKSLVLLFSSSLALGTFLSLQLAHKKDNIIAALAYEGTKLPSSGGTLSSGTYYLDEDITLTNYITIATGNNVIINLNGHTLNAYHLTSDDANVPIVYVNGGTLTINGKDEAGNKGFLSKGTGYKIGGYTRGGAVAVYGGEAIINDCNLTDNKCCFGGAVFISKGNTATLNNCNIYDNDTFGGDGILGAVYVEDAGATVNINGGEIYNNDAGVRLFSNASTPAKGYLNGVYIHDNKRYGACVDGSGSGGPALNISGDTIIENNSTSVSSGARPNLRLNGANQAKVAFTSPLGENASIGVTLTNNTGVFTSGWSQYMGDADPSAYFFSDNTDVIVGKNPSGELLIGVPRTVTYTTEHGTAPDSDTVADGSIIYNEPTSPSQEGYVFKGWYKDDGFENVWDFETDTVTADTTLYAKWDYDPAVANVIKLINDIGDLTYAGGANDSLDDIIAAKAAYDALTPEQKVIVNGVNKDVLDHDIVTYNHVDKVGDLIKAIPEASDSQEYYDAVEAALAAYDALTDEEEAILNAALDFQYKKTLDDNVAAKEVIELIQGIGEVTYNGGQDDSKDDINAALDAYNNLTDDQKAIVDKANKDELDDAKDTYDNVDEAVNLINSIGDINHGGENDSKDAIDAAREAYDNLSDEEKALVDSYNDSTQTLEDAEEVYDVLVKIDDIGEGDDDEKIKAARDAYDALTPEQKDKVSDEYVQILIAAENRSKNTNKQANILFIVFLILFILLIVSGLIVMYVLLKRRKNEKNDNNKQVKLASVSGLLPLIFLASYFTSTKFIILYVLAAVAILVWLTNLILFVSKKRQKAEVKEETKPLLNKEEPKQVLETKPLETSEDEEEVKTITDEKGNIFQIRFIKSFTAKLIQSPEETKKYYEELKNEVLSYKKTNSRISWHYDATNSGRNYVLKFAIRGKTLCVYFPLNVDDYVDSKYKVERVESKKFEDVPCLYRIKNDRRLDYAKELIEVVASNLGLEKGEEQHEVYSNLPYEPNKPLVARGLIKEQKIQVNKPATEPVVLETKTNSDGDEVIVTKDASGNIFEIRYIKSFTAKLSQSEDIVKDYYTELKNYVLSYKDTHSRVSWHYDAINVGRDYVLKFAIRGKTLCVYYALDASKLDEKYKVEEAKGRKFEDVPCLYRIKNDRRLDYAKELIDLLMSEKAISKGSEQNEDYRIPSESTKALLAKGLIKEVKTKVQDKEIIKHYDSISVSKADEEMSDEKAESSIEEVEVIKPRKGSKEIINIDTLSENYNNGDEVTLESLIKKGLVPATTGHIKVLARGVLDKKLDVIANDFSIPAIKMIVLVGGHVKKIK